MTESSVYYRTFIEDGCEYLNPLSFEDGKTFTTALARPAEDAVALRFNFKLETSDDNGVRLTSATAPWLFAGSPLIVKETIRSDVASVIGDSGELLPMNVEIPDGRSTTMWYLHTDNMVPDLDRDRSDLQTVLGHRIASIKRLVLTGDHSPYPPVFKLPECPEFYCYSAELVSRLQKLQIIVGTIFKPL